MADRSVNLSAIGKKNSLFAGVKNSGHGVADIYPRIKAIVTELLYFRNSDAFRRATENEPVTNPELDHLLPDRWLEASHLTNSAQLSDAVQTCHLFFRRAIDW